MKKANIIKNKDELMKNAGRFTGKRDGFIHCEMKNGNSELICAGRADCIAHLCFVALNRVHELTGAPIELLVSLIADEAKIKYDIGDVDFPNSSSEF